MERPAMVKQMSVLIVGDQQPDLDLLVDLLAHDYTVRKATSGQAALLAAGAANPPDLILLGMINPESEGLDLCRRLKVEPTTRDIPLILIVSGKDSDAEARGLEMGAVDCISKRISPPLLKARVKTHLDLRTKSDELREAYRKIADHKYKAKTGAHGWP